MIQLENHLGTIEISHHFLVNLITDTAVSCFGVAGMATCNQQQGIKNKLFKTQSPEQGVRVRYLKQRLVVDLHILVIYGMNISAVVKSIIDKVSYAVEEATGVKVASVNVFVDGMKI